MVPRIRLYMSTKLFKRQGLRQILFDVLMENSNLAKSLSGKSNHAMYLHETTLKLAILANCKLQADSAASLEHSLSFMEAYPRILTV